MSGAQVVAWTMLHSFGDSWRSPGVPRPGAADPERIEQVGKPRIIVIDDEVLIADTVVEILKHEGFEALAAPNGNAAIALAKTWLPDVVLSDVIMPVLNGIETAIRIREIAPNCKVILFSGQAATVDLLEDARQQGHRFEVLAKPIKPEQLVSAIRASFRNPS